MSKKAIIESSTLLFMKYGIKSVSMDDIATKMGISKKTIYTFVDNKDDLVFEVLTHFINEEKDIINHITNNSKNAIDEMASIASYVHTSMSKMKPTLTYDLKKYHTKSWTFLNKDHFAYIESVIQNNIKRGKIEGFYRAEIDEIIHSKIYISLARLLVNEETFPTSKYERGDIYKNFYAYHINGIMNESGRKEIKKIYSKNTINI